MREGLAREFPEAARGAAWVRDRMSGRRGLVRSEPLVWATISAIGAGLVVGSVAQALVGLANEAALALRASPPFALFPLITLSETAAAAAVAMSAGGPAALALYLLFEALELVPRIPGLILFCERSGGVFPAPGPDQCSAVGFLASLWPMFVGIGVGLVIARALTTGSTGVNAVLRVAGALAVALFVVSVAWTVNAAQAGYAAATDPQDAIDSGLAFGAGTVAAAVAAGVIAAHLPRGLRSAAVVALIWMLPWFATQPFHAPRGLTDLIPPESVALIVAGLVTKPVAVVFLLLSAAIATRNRFVPRAMRSIGS
jgi:hypothetical protein